MITNKETKDALVEMNQDILETLRPEDNYGTARAKAIMWVKKHRKFLEELEKEQRSDILKNTEIIVSNFIKEFFNLTEEDFK